MKPSWPVQTNGWLRALAVAGVLVALERGSHPVEAQDYLLVTLAGHNEPTGGWADGPGHLARFGATNDVVVDATGHIYVADGGTIRRISPAGDVGTLAGDPSQGGSADGIGRDATFENAEGMCIDSIGNLYVADSVNHIVRKVTAAGVVTTIAGRAGESGSINGNGAAARFRSPRGIAVDSEGNLYVADSENMVVRKISPTRDVTTLAGVVQSIGAEDGPPGTARFHFPTDVAVDHLGQVYVADREAHTIRKISPNGNVTTFAGSYGFNNHIDGIGTNARFYFPSGVAVDGSGNVFVADSGAGNAGFTTIRRITPAAVVTTIAGPGPTLTSGSGHDRDGVGSAAQFHGPKRVAVDAAGNVFVADSGNTLIRKVAPGNIVTTIAGTPPSSGSRDGVGSLARFNGPGTVEVDAAGNVYVGDSWNSTVRKITPDGEVTTFAGVAGEPGSNDGLGSSAHFGGVFGLRLDSYGNLFVADGWNGTIRKISPAGDVTTFAGTAGQSGGADGTGPAARFSIPFGLAIDAGDNLYVGDVGNQTIRKITPAGVVTSMAGAFNQKGSTDGAGSAARFNEPQGVAVDAIGNVYVADYGNSSIRKITPGGDVTTLAGRPGALGSSDGNGSNALFERPYDVDVTPEGTVYVVDYFQTSVRRIDLTGTVTTLHIVRNPDENPLNSPSGVAVHASGEIFVGDYGNNLVRKLTPVVLVPPAISTEPVGQSVFAGTRISFAVAASGTPAPLYRWQVSWDGSTQWTDANFSGANTATLTISSVELWMNGLSYRCVVTNDAGTAYSAPISLSVTAAVSRILNLSARARVGTGSEVLIPGFVISGSTPKRVLVRAAGPALMSFGVLDALTDPRLELKTSSGDLLAVNDDWSAVDTDTIDQIGAFPFAPSSKDSAIVVTLAPGLYTPIISGANNEIGVALAEVYDLEPDSSRLVNISARTWAGVGADVLIPGITVAGNAPKRLLIRAAGPALATHFNVSGAMIDPQLEIKTPGGTVVAANDNWNAGEAAMQWALVTSSAFTFDEGSADAAIVIELPPGLYTPVVSGKNGSTGVVLVELYELP